MSFDWRQFLTIANILYNDGSRNASLSEAYFRSTIGRAYYSVHCHSRNYGMAHGKTFTTSRNVHFEVIEYYSRQSDKNLQRVGRSLQRLHGWRKKCDYHDNLSISALNAKNGLDCASDIFQILK